MRFEQYFKEFRSDLIVLRNRLPRNTFFCILSGIATYVPYLYDIFSVPCTAAASRYCYAIWLRHLVSASNMGLNINPVTIAEIGPGNSLGPGLAGLLCGATRLNAFDVVNNMDTERNLLILDQLVELFSKQEPIPGADEFPDLLPSLDCYDFPSHILSLERIRVNLQSDRVEAIKAALRGEDTSGCIEIKYHCPWYDNNVIPKESVDMIYSQSVLEHVDDTEQTYSAMSQWLKPGGYVSHVVDFSCHNLVTEWNGHWQYGPLVWRLIRGKKPYLLNRVPCSQHVALLKTNGLFLVDVKKNKARSKLKRSNLAPDFRSLSDDDMTTKGAYILAKKSL